MGGGPEGRKVGERLDRGSVTASDGNFYSLLSVKTGKTYLPQYW